MIYDELLPEGRKLTKELLPNDRNTVADNLDNDLANGQMMIQRNRKCAINMVKSFDSNIINKLTRLLLLFTIL